MSDPNNKIDINYVEDNLEDLLRNLHKQIKTTNWLEENNVEKLEKENPELVKAWNDAIITTTTTTTKPSSSSSSTTTNEQK